MKIHYHSGATLPSSAAKAVHVMKMCRALAAQGHDVTLFGKGSKAVPDTDVFKRYGVDENFLLKRAGNLTVPGVSGLWRIWQNRQKVMRTGQPDLAYGRDPLGLLFSTKTDTPVIYEAHQIPAMRSHKWALRKLMQRPGFSGLVAISAALKQDLLHEYPQLKPDQILVAHDGADCPASRSDPSDIGGRANVPRIGYTGSLHPGKGAEIMCEMAKQMPHIDVHICGGTEGQIAELKNAYEQKNLYFHGHVDHGDLPGYLTAFDVVCAPYQREVRIKSGADISRWISPMKLFEYMAAQKPIICSDLPVIREILTSDANAVLVAPDDIRGWCAAADELISKPDYAQKLARKGYEDLESLYTWDKRAQSILAFASQNL